MSSANPDLAIAASNINKRFGDIHVLKDLSIEVELGAIHGLVGLNGSGKTTSLDCLLGLQQTDSGNIQILGYEPEALHTAKGEIVSIFDTPNLNPNLSVRQTLEHALLLCEKPVRTCAEVESLLKIEKYSRFKIKNLSLGNKRRTSIAHALLGSPRLVLLDEPFNGLDAGGVDDVLALILQLNQEEGTTFLLSSHQLPYLEKVCSHLSILHQGKIALSSTLGDLTENTKATVLIRSDDNKALKEALSSISAATMLSHDDNGFVHVELDDLNSAELNTELIARKIAVHEIHLKKATLDGVFRDVTSKDLT